MQPDIGVGVALETAVVSDLHAAEPDMIARRKTMGVESRPLAHVVERRRRELLGKREIFGLGQLHVAFIALDGDEGKSRTLGERKIVGRGLRCDPAMRAENFREMESLRRLRPPQILARNKL